MAKLGRPAFLVFSGGGSWGCLNETVAQSPRSRAWPLMSACDSWWVREAWKRFCWKNTDLLSNLMSPRTQASTQATHKPSSQGDTSPNTSETRPSQHSKCPRSPSPSRGHVTVSARRKFPPLPLPGPLGSHGAICRAPVVIAPASARAAVKSSRCSEAINRATTESGEQRLICHAEPRRTRRRKFQKRSSRR